MMELYEGDTADRAKWRTTTRTGDPADQKEKARERGSRLVMAAMRTLHYQCSLAALPFILKGEGRVHWSL